MSDFCRLAFLAGVRGRVALADSPIRAPPWDPLHMQPGCQALFRHLMQLPRILPTPAFYTLFFFFFFPGGLCSLAISPRLIIPPASAPRV
jgi:hypothetical protein